jgi:F-type H+-transporting ATPase subunit delta
VTGIIAQRYARALFALAKAGPVQEEWEKQLKQLAALVKTEEGLRRMFLHPALDVAKKQEAASRLTARLNTAEPVKRILNLLIQRNRLRVFPAVSEAFSHLVDRAQGREPVLIQTAHALSDEESKRLKVKLEKVLNKRIELEKKTNPDLIGGIVFQLGSLRYDGSVRGRLSRLKTAATEGA